MEPNTLILELGVAIGLVAMVGLISNRLRFSVIPFFILIGMFLGPQAPVIWGIDLSFTESKPFLDFMGRLGVLFLLFYLGLEFSAGRLLRSGKSVVRGGFIYVLINFTSGLLIGLLMGLPFKEIMVVCGIMTSSSTAIVAKVLTDLKRTASPETEIIMGMIMFDDLFIAMHISFLSGLILSGGGSIWAVVLTSLIALAFILTFIILGRKLVPPIDRLLRGHSSEIFILIVFALLFIIAGFSETIHVAEAIGALMVGLVLADSQYLKRIEQMVLPYKDFFGAMFFFSFGLAIDPWSLGGAIFWGSFAALITILCNIVSGFIVARFSGLTKGNALDIGFTLSARGEFSIIMANLGKTASLLPIIQSFVVVYVLILSIVSPILTKESRRIWRLLYGHKKPKKTTLKKLSDLEK